MMLYPRAAMKAEVSKMCEVCGERPRAVAKRKSTGERVVLRRCRGCLGKPSSKGHNGDSGYNRKDGRKRGAASRVCGATARHTGEKCQLQAGFGTDHVGYGRCKFHGGSTPKHRAAAAREIAAEMVAAGSPVEIHPLDAILKAVSIAAGEVNYFTVLIRTLTLEDVGVQDMKIRPLSRGKEGDSKTETVVEKTTQADLHLWVRARQDSLDRLVKYSKTALDAGIDERRVKMAEQTGGLIVRVLTHALDAIGLTSEQKRRAPEIVKESLSIIEGTAQEVAA